MESDILEAKVITSESEETVQVEKTKTIGEIKIDPSMLYVNNKLTFGALIRATIKDASEEDTGGFFSKAAMPDEDVTLFESFIYVKPNGEDVSFLDIDNKKESEFLVHGSSNPTFDMYDDTIAKAIKKDIGKFKGYLKKLPSNIVTDITKLLVTEEEAIYSNQNFKDSMEHVKKQYKLMMKGIEAERRKYSGLGLNEFLERYAFKKHILLVGRPGTSKTFSATKWIEDSGYASEFIAGSNAIEAIDLLGYWVKDSSGSLIWLDGVLTAAFRKAQTQKTILLFDELLRVPARELSILVGALTPDSDGYYRLRTNRLVDEKDGIGEVELIKVPMKNLHVIATTNIGADFDTEDIDVALQDRFRTHDVSMSTSTLYSICDTVNNGKLSTTTMNSLIDLHEKIKLLVESNELARELSLRHLTEVITFAETASDVFSYLQDLATIICSRDTDGNLNQTEKKIYISTIKKTIK